MFAKSKEFAFGDMSKILEGYEGKWVALYIPEKQIVISGSGNTISEAIEKSRQKGINKPVLIRVPEECYSQVI